MGASMKLQKVCLQASVYAFQVHLWILLLAYSFHSFNFLYLLKIQVQMKGADAWLAPPDTAHALADKLNQQTLQWGRGQKYCPRWYMRGTSFPENHDLGAWFMQETFIPLHPTMHIFQFQVMLSYIKHLSIPSVKQFYLQACNCNNAASMRVIQKLKTAWR